MLRTLLILDDVIRGKSTSTCTVNVGGPLILHMHVHVKVHVEEEIAAVGLVSVVSGGMLITECV